MKKNKLFLSLSGLLLLTLIIASLSVNVQGANTLDFTFEQDFLYSETSETQVYDTPYNIRNQTTFTGHYPAIYSFENDTDGSDPIGWSVIEPGNTNIEVINYLDGHYKVVELNDADEANYLQLTRIFSSFLTFGVFEFWIQGNNTTDIIDITFRTGAIRAITLIISADKIQYYYGEVLNDATDGNVVNDIWYHFKIDFDCIFDTYDFYLNGILLDADIPFRTALDSIEHMYYRTDSATFNYKYYIDAIGYSYGETGYTGIHFDVGTEDAYPQGITWDGTHFWVVGNDNDEVYQYNSTGVYTDVHFNVSAEDTIPQGITWDGTHFWVVGTDNDEVYQYNSTGDYTGIHFDVGIQDISPTDIIWDGTHFWVVGIDNDDVYQYNSIGDYTGTHFNVSAEDTMSQGITWDGTYFWVVGNINDEVYQYNLTGNYTSIYFDVGTEETTPTGIIWDGVYFWVIGITTNDVYQYRYVEFIESSYNVGDNIVPLIEINDLIQEVDKWEFTYSDFPILYVENSDVFSDWDEIDTDDFVNIKDYESYPTDPDNQRIFIDHNTPLTTNLGIERDFNISSGIINVSWSFEYTYNEGATCQNEFTTKVYSYDDTLISYVYTEGINLEYKDDESVAVILNNDIVEDEIYDLNLYINYNDGISILRFFINGVYQERYLIPLLNNTKDGLGKIEIYNDYDIARKVDIYLDNVGVYVNGSSLSTEVAYRLFNLDSELFHQYWYFSQHGYFNINATGEIAFHVSDWFYFVDKASEFVLLSSLEDLDGYTQFIVYQLTLDSERYVYSPLIWMEFYGETQFNSISIGGVKLIDNGHNYFMYFTYGNVNPIESYFWVDSYNRLQFKLIVNDDNLEYIQATFNVNVVSSENRSILFTSNINGDSKGFFSLDYTDGTSNLIEFPYHTRDTKVILPQTKTIDKFTILITDNDLDDSDVCTGYISNISLIYNPDVAITIITLTLIGIIVPLIVMLIPSIIMGKKFGISGTIITFVLMSLICVIGNLIPVWLFFIIAFGCIGFLIMKKEIEVRI